MSMSQAARQHDIFQDFANYLQRFVKLSPQAEAAIVAVAEPFSAAKGTMLQTDAAPPRFLYFMRSGAAHLYFGRGKRKVTTWLAIDTYMITTIDSLTHAEDTRENIEMLEDGELLRISFEDLHRLYDEFHEIERLGRRLTTYYFGVMNRKMHRNYFLTAKERYDQLLEEHPEVAWRIPLGIIASYLGISQETLSRIRNPKYGSK